MPDPGANYDINPLVEGGQVEEITVSNPAAGAEWSFTIPTTPGAQYTYEIKSIAWQMVTDATVSNRTPGVVVKDSGGIELARSATTGNSPATTTSQVNADAGFVGSGSSVSGVMHGFSMPIRHARLTPGMIVASLVTGKGATDQWSNIRIVAIKRPYVG